MAENRTKPCKQSVRDFLESLENPDRQADADPAQLKALILKAMKLNQAADTQGGSH